MNGDATPHGYVVWLIVDGQQWGLLDLLEHRQRHVVAGRPVDAPAGHLDNFHSTQLPIANRHASMVREDGDERGRRVASCFVVNWPRATR
jgi:hypothetical protein